MTIKLKLHKKIEKEKFSQSFFNPYFVDESSSCICVGIFFLVVCYHRTGQYLVIIFECKKQTREREHEK